MSMLYLVVSNWMLFLKVHIIAGITNTGFRHQIMITFTVYV